MADWTSPDLKPLFTLEERFSHTESSGKGQHLIATEKVKIILLPLTVSDLTSLTL